MRWASLAMFLVALYAGCTSFTGNGPSATTSPSDGGAPPSDAGGSSTSSSSSSGSVTDSGSTTAPPVQQITVNDGGFTIDATEVTVAAWTAFKNAHASVADIPNVPTACKTVTLGPQSNCAYEKEPTLPQTCVTWCDAALFCAAANKRLCGRIGAGHDTLTSDGDANNPDKDQWIRACAGGKPTGRYPYGASADGSKCNVADFQNDALLPAGQLQSCQGAESGLFDMSGNAAEWEDACYQNTCDVRGGSFSSVVGQSRCDSLDRRNPLMGFDDVGFRCCTDQ